MILALLHAGPDLGLHDYIAALLVLPWSVVIYGAWAFVKRLAVRFSDEEEKQ